MRIYIGAEKLEPASYHIPRGVESVNGSSANDTGCGPKGCLLDGHIPSFNTEGPNWASKLVTVRKNSGIDGFNYDHVVLTFSFSRNITLRLVELYMLNCPEWKIGAPYISLYGDHGLDFTGNSGSDYLSHYYVSECKSSSCDSLSLFNLNVKFGEPSHSTYHIVVSDVQNIDWVHVGEVSFFDQPANENEIPELCPEPSPSEFN